MPLQTILLALLGGWKKNHLEIAVSDDVSLANLILEHKRDIIRMAKPLSFLYSNQKDDLNTKNVLIWIEQNRPDLYPVFESKEARVWLGKQVREIKELLFGANHG